MIALQTWALAWQWQEGVRTLSQAHLTDSGNSPWIGPGRPCLDRNYYASKQDPVKVSPPQPFFGPKAESLVHARKQRLLDQYTASQSHHFVLLIQNLKWWNIRSPRKAGFLIKIFLVCPISSMLVPEERSLPPLGLFHLFFIVKEWGSTSKHPPTGPSLPPSTLLQTLP